MAKRRYSDQERAEALAALAANGGDAGKTSRQIGIPVRTLTHWGGGEHHPAVAIIAEAKKASLAERLDEIAHALLDAMPSKIDAASLQQVATSLGITIDKARLLRGEPTTINEEKADAARRSLTASDLAEAVVLARAAGAALPGDGGAQPVDTPQPPPPAEAVPPPR